MGGKLYNLGRIGREKYLSIEQDISTYLTQKVGAENYRIPRCYAQKADFGDLDILLAADSLPQNWRDFQVEIVKELEIDEYKSVGNIFSVMYRGFQVDFFCADAENLEIMYHYLSFNDLGNLLGKIFHRFNLKYGQEGLAYVYRHQHRNYKQEKIVSRDFKKIIELIGLDYQTWEIGFERLTDLFEWVMASPYFSVSPYLNPSPKTLKKIRERPTMQAFVKYLKTEEISKEYSFKEDKSTYLPWISEQFLEAQLTEWIAQQAKKEAETQEIYQKFNGKLVLELIPMLKQENLSKFIVEFKNQPTNFKHYILRNMEEQIKKDILTFYQTFKYK
jgi:hypothetical protein